MKQHSDLTESGQRAFKTKEALVGIERGHDQQRSAAMAGVAMAAIPGKATLTSGLAPMAAHIGPVGQLYQSMTSAACDATNLEAANRAGDFNRASWATAGLMRFLSQVPQLVAMVPRETGGELKEMIEALVKRARAALDAGPKTSEAARQAADRGDFAQWRAEVGAWRAKADVAETANLAPGHGSGSNLIRLLGARGVRAPAGSARVKANMDPMGPTATASPIAAVEDDEHHLARRGTQGAGGPLPHLATIQQSFGHHDVSSLRAHIGGEAAAASDALGAEAYAYGDAIAFASEPDLHTAAHEAAHAVQQRRGVSRTRGGNDSYERHADAVADRVVRGLSVAALLDAAPRGGGATAVVQRKEKGSAGSGRADDAASHESAVPMGHEGHKAKLEYQRGNLTGAITLALEAGKTGIPLGDDHVKAFKNTASIKANGFVAKLETAILSGTLDREILDGVKLEFEAKALKLSSDGDKASTAPVTVAVKLNGDVTKWFDLQVGPDIKVKLEGAVEVTLGKEFVAKHLAKVVAAEIEQKALVKKAETVTQALATHEKSVRQLEAQIVAARSRGVARQEIAALRHQLRQHQREVRAGVKRLERLTRDIAAAQVRAARALGGVKNFVAKKAGKALERRALKFVAGKLVKFIPVINALSVIVDVVDLVVLTHALIKGKYGSGGSESEQDGDDAGDSPGAERPATSASSDAKEEAPERVRDQALEIIRAAPPDVVGHWFSAHGDELVFNEVGQAWKAAHLRAQIGNYELVDMQFRTKQVGVGKWDLHLAFAGRDSSGKLRNAKHDFWVSRGGKPEIGAKVGELVFEPIVMLDWNGKE